MDHVYHNWSTLSHAVIQGYNNQTLRAFDLPAPLPTHHAISAYHTFTSLSPVSTPPPYPQRSDPQLLAQFYYADEELNQVATELDSLDGRKDPQRCTLLVNQFRSCQVRRPR